MVSFFLLKTEDYSLSNHRLNKTFEINMDPFGRITREFVIIGGILIYIFGLVGNTLNIYVFANWCRPKRRINSMNQNIPHNQTPTSNSSLYLLVSSCANFIEICYPVLTRIIYDGFEHPKTKGNQIWTCKLRYYVLHTSDTISLICICMAMLDRYFISSRNARLRRLSPSRERTKLIILLLIPLVGLHNIPIAIYHQISDIGVCTISSEIYSFYHLCVIQIFLHGIFPIFFLSIFGGLTYKQLRLIQHQNFNSDKQLSRMLLLLCLAILISSVPYCIQYLYFIITDESAEDLSSYRLLLYYISLLLFYGNATLSFYIFFLSTPNFRKQLKKNFFWKLFHRNLVNDHAPANTSSHIGH